MPPWSALAVFVALAGTVALVIAPWLRPDLLWKDVADAPNHLVRIYVVDATLRRGEWFPRWLPDLYLGYGYPLLNFYAPSTYYVATLLHRVGMTIYASFQWTGALSVALGAGGAYALATGLTRRLDAALLAAAAYVLAPYPFITNLYVRAAVPEALALALVPWVLLAGWHSWRRGGDWCAVLAMALGALLLTHNISALMGAALLASWLIPLAALDGSWRLRGMALSRTATAMALGLGLGAFFWLPALAESSLVQIRLAQGDFYDPRNWLFDPTYILPAVARPDYPHTRLGPVDFSAIFDYRALGQAVPEKISLWQLTLWVAAVAAALGVVVHASRPANRSDPRLDSSPPSILALPLDEIPLSQRQLALLSLWWAGIAAFCWFLNTTWSRPIWSGVPLLSLAQFPWRAYGILAVGGSLSAGLALAALPSPSTPIVRLATRGAGAILIALLAFGSLQGRPVTFGPEPSHDIDARDLVVLEYNRYGAGTTSGGEFLPLTVSWQEDKWIGEKRGISLYETLYPQAGWQAGLARVLDGRAAIGNLWQAPNRIAADMDAETASSVGFHQLFFAGWRAYIDGMPVALRPAYNDAIIPATLGFMAVDVPAGKHRVEVRFGPTTIRTLAAALSAAAAVATLLWLARDEIRSIGARLRGGAARAPLVAAVLTPLIVAGCAAGSSVWSLRPERSFAEGASVVALDIAGLVARSEAETAAPSGSGRGLLPPYLTAGYQRIGGEERRWLYMHPPASVVARLRVPERAYFQAGLAIDPQTWLADTGDGVRFILEADTPAGRVQLLNRHLNPRARSEERGWVDVWVSLASLAGQDVRIMLRTDAVGDATFDWAGWSNPQVVVYRAARPNPGTPHKW